MSNRFRSRAAAGAVAVLLAACGTEGPGTESPEEPPTAEAVEDSVTLSARLVDAEGQEVGSARLEADRATGVRLLVEASGLPPGEHGVHLHDVGSCEARNDTAFAAAGPHWNPEGLQHGLENPEGPHAGDMPNLEVADDGQAADTLTLMGADGNQHAGLLEGDGTAVVIHADRDDQQTDPSGESGARIACGVLAG